jgi:hypothetical protein
MATIGRSTKKRLIGWPARRGWRPRAPPP